MSQRASLACCSFLSSFSISSSSHGPSGRPSSPRRTPGSLFSVAAAAVAVTPEYSLDSDQTVELVQVTEAPSFYNGFIIFAVQTKRQEIDCTVWMGEMWLQLDDFKDALNGYLLDGDISAYKDGLTDRIVHHPLTRTKRHIRTKPASYCIPRHIWGFLANQKFRSHISNILSGLRSDIKTKLGSKENWKSDLYTVIQSLIGGNNTRTHSKITITLQMWGHVAWLYYTLKEHEKFVKKGQKKDRDFWDDTDAELRDIRFQYSMYEEPVRSQKISVIFTLCLEKHKAEKKPKKNAKLVPDTFPISSWQRQLQAAIEEMNGYDVEEMAMLMQGTTVDACSLEEIDADIEAECVERTKRAARRDQAEDKAEDQAEGAAAGT
ncbi:hypothetical protein CONPUDRAFT_77152 [Coniophora puteana RWD-64-598 SS2]|uniref:Uncharacterized protein n=1 Tax=Coniophora puteana (strain RWD-64-598) TaxID=741705 RepID=A0A5M3M9C8_CONPW|nr:uncharacterized protein CONPUDRAFT_77152 [Coniophora puteana RWD-64-598 SS2]EIW75464.1 hypothetical protein CONPUDRAFT_77152 [Coniophora puteana RWD-64-598 SS2]